MLAAATASGAGVGAFVGAIADVLDVPSATPAFAAALVGLAVCLDLLARAGLRPLSVGRQVPVEWGRVLPRTHAAFLYGLRLGVGPLTILQTWLWWAATLLAASHGVGAATMTGGAFGVARVIVMSAASRSNKTRVPDFS